MVAEKTDTIALFGLPLTNVTMDEAVARIDNFVMTGSPHQIATANLDFARHSLEDEHLQGVLCDCAMVLPDGAPMLWASRLMNTPLKQRVTGVDLVPRLAQLSAARGYKLYVLGSSEGSAAAAMSLLGTRYPGLVLAGRYSPPLASLEQMDHEDLLRRIEQADPDILLVAFGNPKQEFWLHRHRARLKVPVMIGIGGTLDMIAGSLKRAPLWIQRCQLEWFYRMMQEPRRLLPRYWQDALALFRHLPMVLLAKTMQPASASLRTVSVATRSSVRVITLPENLSAAVCTTLQSEVLEAVQSRQAVVLNMHATTRIEADGLGALLQARRTLRKAESYLWLVGVSRPVRRVMRCCAMTNLFQYAPDTDQAVYLASLAILDAEWAAHGPATQANVELPEIAVSATATR